MLLSLLGLRQLMMGSAGMGSLLVVGLPRAWADCPNCQSGAPAYSTQAPVESSPVYPHHMEHYSPQPSQNVGMKYPPMPPNAAPPSEQIVKPGYAVLPPPGTLGRTYLRQSWPIPKDEHPRTAIIQITAPGFTEIEIEGLEDLEGFQRQDGVWIFKTTKSLIPGISHIYHVKAGYKNREDNQWEVRTVRMIPGRVVTLEF